MSELDKVLEDLGHAFEEFKSTNNERIKQIEEQGHALPDLCEKQLRVEAKLEELADVADRLSKLEAKSSLPRRGDGSTVAEEDLEHVKAWEDWIRSPKDPEAITKLKQAERAASAVERPKYDHEGRRLKAITITTTGGGNAIPTLIHDRIVNKIYDLSPIRQIANVAMSSNENTRFIVVDNDAAGGWAAAGGTRSETATPSFRSVTLTYGTCYAYPTVYEEAMNDLAFDLGGFVEDVAARVLASQEGTAFVTGNGSSRPTGFMNGGATSPLTIVSTADDASPERAFGSIQYLATGAAAGFQADYFGGADSPEQNPQGVLVDTVYALRAQYRANARWVANKATLGVVRKIRDVDGNYVWQPGLIAGQPATLMGYPITEAEDMPDIAANAHPMAFGDFNEAYQIGDIIGNLRMTVDDNITAPGNVKFYIRRRVGGNLLNDDAIKVVKCATS